MPIAYLSKDNNNVDSVCSVFTYGAVYLNLFIVASVIFLFYAPVIASLHESNKERLCGLH